MTTTNIQRFSVFGLLGQSLSILSQNLVPFGTIALIVTLPTFAYALLTGTSVVTADVQHVNGGYYAGESVFGFGAITALLLQMVLRCVAVGAISYGVFRELLGQRVSLDEAISRAISVFLPVVGVAIVATLAICVAFALLVIPGFIVITMLWLAVPVVVVERPGVFASLSRSAVLTKGHRWRILGVLLIIGISSYVIEILVGRIFGAFGGTFIVDLLQWLVTAVIAAYSAVTIATGYSILRFEKEGVDVHSIAQVFD